MDITGIYTKTVFRNESDGFTIFKFKLNKPIINNPLIEFSCKGKLHSSFICTPLKLTGELIEDKFGSTFIVEKAEPFSDDENVTISYLSSQLFNGIAETLAERIVEVSGPDIFSFIHKEDAKEQLLNVKGLTEEKVNVLIQTVSRTKNQNDMFDFISSFGGSFKYAEILFEEFGLQALPSLIEKPYETGIAVDLPFGMCDCIAKRNGIKFNDVSRIKAIILTVLKKIYGSGDMYVLLERVFKGVEYISKNVSAFPDCPISNGLVITALDDMKQVVSEIKVINEETTEFRYYLNQAFFDEKIIADNIGRLQRYPQKTNVLASDAIISAEKHLNITYSEKQKECFRFLETNGVKIVTGGPGTGKSTVINGLIYGYKEKHPDAEIKIMAPTGRAAQRISEITGLSAGTIHRMLSILPYSKDQLDTAYNGDYPADLLIVDEASMLDSTLMRLLIKSIKSTALVLLVGDINQLPSVGAGNVLNELIISNKIDTVHLDTNYRQKNKSTIIENAISVNSGSTKLINDDFFEIIECDSEEEIQQTIVKRFVDIYNTHHPYDVQVLSSTKKGPAGTIALNKQIQEMINTEKTVTAYSNSKFRIKDKVMTIRNNYDAGYFNGDIGTISSADENFIYVQFFKEEVLIPKHDIQDVELAYACTVHKSQGSEYDTTIIALPETPSVMLRRNLLYTAITRAKKKVLIVTQKGCIDKSVSTIVDAKRKSALSEKIIERFGGN